MEAAIAPEKFVIEGTGKEILAHAKEWENLPYLRLEVVSKNGTHSARRLPDDVVWEGTVPLLPLRGRTEPITTEMVKQWLEDEEGE